MFRRCRSRCHWDVQAERAFPIGVLVCLIVLAVGCHTGGRSSGPPETSTRSGGARLVSPHIVLIAAERVGIAPGSAVARLASEGTLFPRVRTVGRHPASVRASVLTGLNPDVLGLDSAHHAGLQGIPLPEVRAFPERLRQVGYYTVRSGEAAHNLFVDTEMPTPLHHTEPVSTRLLGVWDAAGPGLDWRRGPEDPCTSSFGCRGYGDDPSGPVFVMFNVGVDDSNVDATVDRIRSGLAADGPGGDLVLLVVGLDGNSPLIAWGPSRIEAGVTRQEPVSTLDVAPTILALAGVPASPHHTGRAVLGPTGDSLAAPTNATEAWERPMQSWVEPWADRGPPVAATPRGYPTGGLFHAAPWVELWCDTDDATIVYATELDPPFHWRLYTEPFRMHFWKLRVQCGRLGYLDSPIVTYDFDVE